jgi:hypothetical protein
MKRGKRRRGGGRRSEKEEQKLVKDKRTGGEEKVKEERRERAWSILGLGGKDLGTVLGIGRETAMGSGH